MSAVVPIQPPYSSLTLAEVMDRRMAHYYHNNFERCYITYRVLIHDLVREHLQMIMDGFNRFSQRNGYSPRNFNDLLPRQIRDASRLFYEKRDDVRPADQAHVWGIHADLVQTVVEWLTEPRP